jgi:hypothetical protein
MRYKIAVVAGVIIATVGLFIALLSLADAAHADDEHFGATAKGPIESFPPGLIGTWQVGGETYSATVATRFRQSDGPFAVGACVEIVYQPQTRLAFSIETEDSRECNGGLIIAKATGTLNAFPPGLIGTWTVNTTTYQVVTSTVLDDDHGDFYVGACVEVRYIASDPNRTAVKVETESNDDCEQGGVVTPTLNARGIIESRPPTGTLFGTWVIGGNSYEAISGTTRFRQEHGGLRLGKCAKVTYYEQGVLRVATRIASEDRDRCRFHGQQHKFYGAISALPGTPDLIGIWEIGGRSVVVSPTTQLKHGPFTIGLIVEVHYVRADDDSLVATKIEGKQSTSRGRWRVGKAFGILQDRPTAPTVVGPWVIASVTYSVSTTTKLEGSLNIGDCVQVHYRADATTGDRLARKIDTKSPVRCASLTGEVVSKTYGFVDQMPVGGYIGTWVIGGVSFDANTSTLFEEEHGVLAAGSFVEVYFVVRNGVNVALKMETRVPPNAGSLGVVGTLSVPEGASSPDATGAETWYVDGQAYSVVDPTLLDDAAGALSTGRKVAVNAYIDASTGARIATQITALGDKSVNLPVVSR